MKYKHYIIGIALLIILLIIGEVVAEPKATLKIDDIKIIDKSIDYQQMQYYGVTENEVNGRKMKAVVLQCEIKNISFIKKITNAKVAFDKNQQLPNIVLGDKLDAGQPENLILKAHENKKCTFLFLTDAENCSNEEIISEISEINLYVIEQYPEHRKKTPKIISKKSIKCKVE